MNQLSWRDTVHKYALDAYAWDDTTMIDELIDGRDMSGHLESAVEFIDRYASKFDLESVAEYTARTAEQRVHAYHYHRKNHARAYIALGRARVDVAQGVRLYCYHHRWGKPHSPATPQPDKPGLYYVDNPDSMLRFVGRVMSECGVRNGLWDNKDTCGWITDAYGEHFKDGTGLVWGVVYQLPGRDGRARFVAVYQFGGCDGGPTLHFGHVYEGTPDADNPQDDSTARDAAYAADSMAQHAAETEHEYQIAWAAGNRWADKLEAFKAAGVTACELAIELRTLRRSSCRSQFPASFMAVESSLADARHELTTLRQDMKRLADGEQEPLCFAASESQCDAFNDAAGHTVLTF